MIVELDEKARKDLPLLARNIVICSFTGKMLGDKLKLVDTIATVFS